MERDCGCINGTVGIINNDIVGAIGLYASDVADYMMEGSAGVIHNNIIGQVGIVCSIIKSYLFVTPTDIDIPQDGLPVFVNVESNAVWAISPVIKWDEGDGNITVIANGKGNEIISISSDANEGIDREQQIIIQTLDNINEVTILAKQIGLREGYNVLEGEYILSNGETYNVLK